MKKNLTVSTTEHPKIIQKSLTIASQLFPGIYSTREKYQVFHFSLGFIRSKLIGIGVNDPLKPNAKALKFAERFNLPLIKKWPYVHSEIDLLQKLWGRIHVGPQLKIVNIRLNKRMELRNSKPCPSCASVLKALNVSKIWWSDEQGEICQEN